jgi:hypothetical protein
MASRRERVCASLIVDELTQISQKSIYDEDSCKRITNKKLKVLTKKEDLVEKENCMVWEERYICLLRIAIADICNRIHPKIKLKCRERWNIFKDKIRKSLLWIFIQFGCLCIGNDVSLSPILPFLTQGHLSKQMIRNFISIRIIKEEVRPMFSIGRILKFSAECTMHGEFYKYFILIAEDDGIFLTFTKFQFVPRGGIYSFMRPMTFSHLNMNSDKIIIPQQIQQSFASRIYESFYSMGKFSHRLCSIENVKLFLIEKLTFSVDDCKN